MTWISFCGNIYVAFVCLQPTKQAFRRKGNTETSELTIIQVNDILTIPLLNMWLEQKCLKRDRDLYHRTSLIQNWDQMTGMKQHQQVYLSPRKKKENTNNDLILFYNSQFFVMIVVVWFVCDFLFVCLFVYLPIFCTFTQVYPLAAECSKAKPKTKKLILKQPLQNDSPPLTGQ